MMPTASFLFPSRPPPALCSCWKGGVNGADAWTQQFKCQMCRNEEQRWYVDGVTSLLSLIMVNSVNIRDQLITCRFLWAELWQLHCLD